MRRTVTGLALLAASLAAAPPAVAAHSYDFTGFRCSFSSLGHPQVDDTQVGTIDGGPLAVTEAGVPVPSVTLICTIQVGWQNWTHAGADAARAEGWGPGVATVPPTLVSYVIPPDAWDVTLCSEVRVDTPTGHTSLYWNDFGNEWTTDPNVGCYDLAPDPPSDPFEEYVDPVLCPVLAVAFPPEGDIPGLWDCPPYNW